MKPLVSCIMLTTGNRPDYELQAVRCFENQSYENRELVIVKGIEKIGFKRNRGCYQANGEIIIHWDNDDLYSPDRISDQVKRLVNSGVDLTGYHTMNFFDEKGQWWRYSGKQDYILGVSMCYWKSFWETHKFNDNLHICEDLEFQKEVKRFSSDSRFHILARIHKGNTSVKRLENSRWSKIVSKKLISELNILRRIYSESNCTSRSEG
jgi:glycosyltransferase involved in cell wall biosynthesis